MVILGLVQRHTLNTAPTTSDVTHTYPFATKNRGTVYLTDAEHTLDLVTYAVLGVFAVATIVVISDQRARRRKARMEQRKVLERFDGWQNGEQ
jgi:hypothetical protein